MERRSLVVGLFGGAALAALASAFAVGVVAPAHAEDAPSAPAAPGLGNPQGSLDPLDQGGPGRTINPSSGSRERSVTTAQGFGTSGSNQHAIAITGPVAGGESVVYFFDTDHQRLLVYQYRAGSGGSVLNPGDRGGIALVAARHFDYDLKLEDYRDRSEKTRDQLKAAYDAMFPTGAPAKSDELPVKKVEIPGGK
jgi:hypothetical protein